jgi:transcriptional regulator with XRE-family HTH domain
MILEDGRRLQRVMRERNVSHRQLAKALKWSAHSRVSRLVAGTVKSVTAEQAQTIADTLQVQVPFLFVTQPSSKPARGVNKERIVAA